MLADFSRDDRVVRTAKLEQAPHRMLGLDDVGAMDIVKAARRHNRRKRDLDGHDLADLAGPMSIWILQALGAKLSRRPVTRSSKRAPMQTITSHPCIARLAS